MASLLGLAPEILIKIIQALAKPVGNHAADFDLYRLAHTCRTFFNLTKPYLYTRFVQNSPKQLPLFLRTILQKPEYAARVKMIHLEYLNNDEYEREREREKGKEVENGSDFNDVPSERESALLLKACDTYGPLLTAGSSFTSSRFTEHWRAACKARDPLALLAIAIISLTNLEIFDMRAMNISANRFSFVRLALEVASKSPSFFLSNLKEISFSLADSESSIDFRHIICFLVPSVQKMTVLGISTGFFGWQPKHLSIETLDLRSCALSDPGWAKFLRAMSATLKSLSYTPGKSEQVKSLGTTVQGIGIGLTQVENTLEKLSLTDLYLPMYDENDLGSLNGFCRLKEIEIQIALLLGTEEWPADEQLWEMLPRSLENVTFWGGEYSFDGFESSRAETLDEIIGMVLIKESHFPALRQLSMRSFDSLDLLPLKEFVSREVCIFLVSDL